MNIVFSGPAHAFYPNSDDDNLQEILAAEELKEFDGFELGGEDNQFAEWIPDHDDPLLENAGISGGQLSFSLVEASGKLKGSVTYELARELSAAEIEALKEYTIGQLLDGIGSSFEQERTLEGQPMLGIDQSRLTFKTGY